MENYFKTLNEVNVGEHIEKKNGLSYLSWVWAWGELKKLFPTATYTIYENADGLFYHTDGKTAWVKTGVTVEGIEHIEYLPVMDYRNKSIPLESITSFDVNKAIRRSLTKAVARHGLGLYIYAGEDLPDGAQPPENPDKVKTTGFSKEPPIDYREQFTKLCMAYKVDFTEMAKQYNLNKNTTQDEFKNAVLQLEKDIADKLKSQTAEKSKKTAK